MSSGIYKITNTITNDFYIGSSCELNTRKRNHFRELSNNTHNNKFLQNSYIKYGKSNFKYEVLATCPKEYLLKLEQWFIDNLKPAFNCLQKAGNSLGYKHDLKSILVLKQKDKSYCSKTVYQYTNTGMFIKEWSSCSEYARFYGISRIAVIKAINRSHKCKGFIVSYNPPTL